MIDLLRDSVWNGITAIATIIALAIAIRRERVSLSPFIQRLLIVLGRAIVGILVIFPGPRIESTVRTFLDGGFPNAAAYWQRVLTNNPLNDVLTGPFGFALFPGTVAALVASYAPTFQQALRRTILALILALLVTDIFFYFGNGGGDVLRLMFSFLSDIVGAVIAGPIITYLVRNLDKAFAGNPKHEQN